ncbi:MAG: hypothetical protein PW788_14805 [Micavibrio sp.]|nr:hypothetical protein [Micavibrio sp.]
MTSLQKTIVIVVTALIVIGVVVGVVLKERGSHGGSAAISVPDNLPVMSKIVVPLARPDLPKEFQPPSSFAGVPDTVIGVTANGKPVLSTSSMPALPSQAPGRPVNVIGTYKGAAPAAASAQTVSTATIQMLTGNLNLLKSTLTSALNEGKITLNDLEKLHFGGVSNNIDPMYAVFNPKGNIKFHPMLNQWINQKLLDKLTTQKNMPLIFSLRRMADAKKRTTDTLFAIVPNPVPELCIATQQTLSVTAPFKLEVDNSVIAMDDGRVMPLLLKPACLVTPDKRVYYFYPLRHRTFIAGDKAWKTY